MHVRMLETRRGTADGYTIRQYQRGEIYDLPDTLANAFFAAGFAVPVRQQKPAAPRRPKPSRRMIRLIKE